MARLDTIVKARLLHLYEPMVSSARLVPYLPRSVVERPDRRFWTDDATVVFADISGFTKLSEKLAELGKAGAEELVAILNGTFEALLGVAAAEGGDLLKFGGDALLLQFVGPDHAARCCRAAAGMRAALKDRGPIVTGRGKVVLRISMGVHTGPFQLVLAGQHQRELFVVGEHASTVTDMESVADAGEILLSPATAACLPAACLGAPKGAGVLLRRPPPGEPLGAPGPPRLGGDLTNLVPAAVRRRAEADVHDQEHRHVGVGFVHMGAVDAYLRERGPDALADQLDLLVGVAERACADAGICLVASDVGSDGAKLLLTAGAPEGVEDAEGRLLDVGRSILDASYELPVRVGVNAGYGFAAEMGAPWRRTYTAMGDVTNLAARLMGKARPGQLIASKALVDRSATVFERTALEPFMVKGKRHPQEAFAVGARIGRVQSAAIEVAFAGRTEELAAVSGRLDGTASGRGAVVEIVGGPGIGKSRLVAEALRGRDERVIRVTCDSFQSDRAYFVARLVLRAALGISQALDSGEAGEVLTQRVLDEAPELLPWVPLLAIAVDAEVPETPEVAATDPSFRRSVLAEVADQLLSIVLADPVVLVFEDAMWMDEASALLFARLLREVERRPWVALLSTRGGATGLHAGLGLTTDRIVLEPLGPEVVAGVAAAATEDDPMPEADLALLCERAGGNPLFLLELLAARVAGGAVDQLPSTLEDIVAARVDQLPPAEARLLRYAAVLGERFRPSVFDAALGDLVGRSATRAFAGLGEFVVPDAGDLRFTHGLVRQVAYEGLPYARRRELHHRVADVLAGEGDRLDESRISLLSLHYDRARDHELAWRWSRRAGDQARAKYANVEAATFFERALDNVRHVPGAPSHEVAVVAESLGDAAEVAGRFELAARGYRQARELRPPDDPYLPELYRKEGQLRERMARYPAAVQWYRKGMAAARSLPEPAASRALGAIEGGYAAVRMRQNRYRETARWCRRAIAHAEAAGDLRSMAQGYTLLESALTELGDPQAADLRGRAVELFERLGDLIGLGNALSNMAIDAAMEGRWDDATAFFERAREVRIVAGDVVGVANVSHNLGELRSDQGRLDEAERLQREARRIWRAARYTMGVGAVSSALGRTLARLGRADDSLELLAQARQSFVDLAIPDWIDEADARITEALVFAGRYVEAVEVADALFERGASSLAPQLHRLRGIARGVCIDPEAAASELHESLRLARATGLDYEAALTLFELSRLPVLLPDEREAAVFEAEAIAKRLGVDLEAVVPVVPWG